MNTRIISCQVSVVFKDTVYRFTDICSPDKCSQDLLFAREICQYGHRRYLTNYFYRTMHYSTKHGLAIAVVLLTLCGMLIELSLHAPTASRRWSGGTRLR